MKKEEIKLICTDIDGTLINDEDQLPSGFNSLIDQLEKEKIYFVAASGRGRDSIKNKLNYKSDYMYYISDNGAILSNEEEIFYKNNFAKDEVDKILKVFRECEEASIIATTEDISYVELHGDHNEDFLKEFFVNYKVVDDINACDVDIVKITMRSNFHSKENFVKNNMQKLKEKYHLVRAGHPWIDIMKADSNKGKALETLLEMLDIKKEATIGFGDFPNDIHMLEVVNKAYAMKEAHPDVIKVADETIGSNNDNSVIKKINKLLKLN